MSSHLCFILAIEAVLYTIAVLGILDKLYLYRCDGHLIGFGLLKDVLQLLCLIDIALALLNIPFLFILGG